MDQPTAIDPTLRAETDPEPADEGPPSDLEARWIGHFAVLRKLGEGGMGTVYAAYDERLERRVAIKLLHGADHIRLLREAQALARLSHPHVVQIYEIGPFEDRVYVAMEYVDGPTLSEWLAAAPRGADEIMDVFVQAGRGLAAAHARGLVHRDFKPSNVIVGNDGRARVLDFGLARAGGMSEEAGPKDQEDLRPEGGLLMSPLTQTGARVGTPAYMSPEQHAGRPVDARSDQFSFCAALYEALYGQRPFAGDNHGELAASVISGAMRTPPTRADLAPAIAEAVVRGLSSDPAGRWPTMDDLLEVLASGSGQGGVLEEARARALIAVFALVLGIAVFVIAFVSYDGPRDTDPLLGVLYALGQLLMGLAGLPFAFHYFRRPRQRVMIYFGMVMFSASFATRLVCWRAGFTGDAMNVAETLVYAVGYAAFAAGIRQTRVLLALPILFTALAVVVEFGGSPLVLPISWIVAVSLAIHGLRGDLRVTAARASATERLSSSRP